MKIHHLGVAVRSLDEASAFYREALGLTLTGSEEVAQEGVRVAFLQAGEPRIELLEALDETSPIARFIAKRGEGIHHVCLEVEDLDAVVASVQSRGGAFIEPILRIGAGGHRIAFVHPRSTHGVLVELKEVVREAGSDEPFRPGEVVVVYLSDPPAKVWGVLKKLDSNGVAVEGIDLRFFEQWLNGVASGELRASDVSLAFYPLARVAKVILDRGTEEAPALQDQFQARAGKGIREFLGG